MRPLLDLAAALGARNDAQIRPRMKAAVESGWEAEAGELALMAVFVLGFPAGLAAARHWAGVRGQPPPPEPTVRPDYRKRGEAGFAGVYGSQSDALRTALADTHPALPDLVTEVGYGWMMARPGMTPADKECCMVSMLIPTGFLSPLYSHLRGALRLGAPPSRVDQAIQSGLDALRTPMEPAANYAEDVWRTWDQVRSRAAGVPEET